MFYVFPQSSFSARNTKRASFYSISYSLNPKHVCSTFYDIEIADLVDNIYVILFNNTIISNSPFTYNHFVHF